MDAVMLYVVGARTPVPIISLVVVQHLSTGSPSLARNAGRGDVRACMHPSSVSAFPSNETMKTNVFLTSLDAGSLLLPKRRTPTPDVADAVLTCPTNVDESGLV